MWTIILELLGVAFLVAFAFCVWPPAALAAAGVVALYVAWDRS